MKIASAAKESEYLESFVDWCHAALEAAKIEAKDEKFVKQIQATIQVNNFGYIHLIIQYARHYNPRLVYILPHFYNLQQLILQEIYVLNKEMWA